MIRPIRPTPPEGNSSKANNIENDEKRRIEKTSEVDPEQQKKRKQFRKVMEEFEEIPKEEKEYSPSPYQVDFHGKKDSSAPIKTPPLSSQKSEQTIKPKPEENLSDEIAEGEEFATKPHDLKKPKSHSDPDELENHNPNVHLNTPFAYREKEKTTDTKEETKVGFLSEKQKSFYYENNESSKSDEKPKEIPPVIPIAPSILPAEIQHMTTEITSQVSSYLSPAILPVFEKMIGHILVMKGQPGIMQTEILLNNPNFENSIFFGSTIILEKYSTAPDSFNIQFTGTPQAVSIFNEHLEKLTRSFQRGNFNFRIGRIEASHRSRNPLYRRDLEKNEGF